MLESNAKRLFTAIPIPASIRNIIAAQQQRWQNLVAFRKWTHPEDVHITLVFIGQTEPKQLPSLIQEIRKIASSHPPFELSLSSLGSFGRPHKPSILWIGMEGNVDRLRQLQGELHTQIYRLGFPLDQRPYSPHLTVARQYTGSTLFDAKRLQLAQLDGQLQSEHRSTVADEMTASPGTAIVDPLHINPAWTVDRIALYESRSGRIPMYEPIEWFPLNADPPG